MVNNVLQDLGKLRPESGRRRNVLLDCVIGSRLPRQVRNILDRVIELLREGKSVEGFLIDKTWEPVVKLTTSDIREFSTLQECLEGILRLLALNEVITIVILGLPGVGKTTIMQNLNNHVKVARMFNIVIWITVSEDRTMENLQADIAQRLGLDVEGTAGHLNEVARSISDKLNGIKYLILLDNVRVDIDHEQLHAIGIPDNKNGSKVVLTTRKLGFCFKMKGVRPVMVKQLTSDESWGMFKRTVNDHRISRPEVMRFARRVADQCGGLPFVINMVANNFKFKDSVNEWRKGLAKFQELAKFQKGSKVEIQGLTEIHAILKCSYDDLKDEQQKKCFLYSALHPAGTEISTDYLVKCWAVERLLGNIDDRTFRDACDDGYDILRHLANVSLLHPAEGLKHVQVNDMVHLVARHISLEDSNCKFLVGDTFQNVEDLKKAERIFVIDEKLDLLPTSIPRCNMLLSLLLHKNHKLEKIPQEFFTNMPKLLVLNLYKTGIDSLPPSLEYLTALKALFLNGCTRLTCLPLQNALLPHHLELLDLRGCKVIFIPSFIGELVHLRCLRLSYYKPGTVNGWDSCEAMETNGDVILKLSKLEELVIDVMEIDGCDFYGQWCTEATHVIRQVEQLQKLTSLKICFPKLADLMTLIARRSEFQGREPLSTFGSFVGYPITPLQIPQGFDGYIKRYLRYCYDESDYRSATSSMLLEMDALELIGHNNISCLSDFVQALGLNGVLCCSVESCRNLVTILDGNNARGAGILPSLEHLHLKNLINLTSIFKGPLPSGSLSELHTIIVNHCISLRELFSNGQIQQLSNLRKLIIHSCCYLNEELIAGGGSMQNLEVLELHDMPNLRAISTGESLAWPQLRELRVYNCPALNILPFNETNAEKLELIEGEQAWWNGLSQSNMKFKYDFERVGTLSLSG